KEALMSIPVISRSELEAKLAGPTPPVLAEALGALFFDEGHLPDAVNLDPTRFEELVPELFPERDAEIVVYCASETCRNSHEAAARLSALGYGNVSVYAGGKADWVEAGLPVEIGAAV
ncbi:MAG: rhodanese-like domain-containing protein, partial [Gaiellaceae bacterium]